MTRQHKCRCTKIWILLLIAICKRSCVEHSSFSISENHTINARFPDIQNPNRSPASRVRLGKEEGANIVQFSPRGGNGTVFAPSDVGAGGGGRTRTSLRTRDFESRASANSTTPAYGGIIPRKSPVGKKKYSASGIPFLGQIWYYSFAYLCSQKRR